jgi:hypothetical protein
MKKIKFIALFFLLLFAIGLRAQKHIENKKDTLYYLIDTARTLKSDRVLGGFHTKYFIFYHIACPCFVNSLEPDPLFSYYNRKSLQDTAFSEPVYVAKKKVKAISFTSLADLIRIVCKEGNQFNFNHVVFFIESLPNRKYMIRQVKLQGPRMKDD